MSSLSHQGTPSPDDSNDASTSGNIEERQQNGLSQYEQRRKVNIAENRELLAALGLSGGGSRALKELLMKGDREKEEEGERHGFDLFFKACLMIWHISDRQLQMIVHQPMLLPPAQPQFNLQWQQATTFLQLSNQQRLPAVTILHLFIQQQRPAATILQL